MTVRTWAAILLVACAASVTAATRPREWVATPEDLALGFADGVAVSRRGRLTLAPALRASNGDPIRARPAQIWSMAADPLGNVYVGTGPDGVIYEVGPSGVANHFATIPSPLVTALAWTPEGDLLAAGSPGGSVYRIRADGTLQSWAETEASYVWSLALTDDGRTFAGTGDPGSILRIHRSGSTEMFFDSQEAHVVVVRPRPGGGLLAGGAGMGLVYQIDDEGNALVLHDSDLPEVADLAAGPSGEVVAALLDAPVRTGPAPALRLRLPDGVRVGATADVGDLEETQGPTLRGVIEGLPGPKSVDTERVQGRVIRIGPEGQVRELWTSPTESPFCVAAGPDDTWYFGTGEPARIHRVERDGDVSVLATLPETYVTGVETVDGSPVIATSNPASTYHGSDRTDGAGVFVSPPFDSGGPSRWGSIRWHLEGDPGPVEIYTRTGNSRDPDATWSGWSPALTRPEGSPIDNPDGRFVQWRARFTGMRPFGGWLSRVSVRYENRNRAPRLRGFRIADGSTATSGAASFRWETLDPDADAVVVALEYRSVVGETWQETARRVPADPDEGASTTWNRTDLSWDTTDLTEGPYDVRPIVSDEPSNTRDDGRRVPGNRVVRLVVDRTPPVIEVRAIDGEAEITATDAHSEIRRLVLETPDGRQSTLRPADGICDSPREVFRLAPPPQGPWTVRGYDAAGNSAEASPAEENR